MTITRGGYAVDYTETGSGPTIVLVPGSYSSTAAWGPVTERLRSRFRVVSTSLLGTGRTDERRDGPDIGLAHQCDALDAVLERAGGPVHLVGHSWGAVAALMTALASPREILSLSLFDSNQSTWLLDTPDKPHFDAMRAMGAGFVAAHRGHEPEAARRVIDFFAGPGSHDALPGKVRDYVVATTPANVLDWESFFHLDPDITGLAALRLPCLFAAGADSHPMFGAVARRLASLVPGARLATVEGASHFLITTHADAVADLIAGHAGAAAGAR